MRLSGHYLKRFHDHQDDYRKQNQHRKFVEPAIENVTESIAIVLKIVQQFAAIDVIDHEDQHEKKLRVHPTAADAVAEPEPQAEDDGEHRAGRHDAEVEFALHYFETLYAYRVARHSVIDE